MVWIVTSLFLLTLIYLFVYRGQIRSLNQQLQEIQERPTNVKATQHIYQPEINQLVYEINQAIDKERMLRVEMLRRETISKKMLTNLSHDVRTPLTSLDGYFQLLSESDNPEDQARYIAVIRERIGRLSRLLDQLFLYMKLEDSSYEVPLESLNLNEFLLNQLFTYFEELEAARIEPVIELHDEVHWILGNQELLERIIDNLIKNAIVHGSSHLSIELISYYLHDGAEMVRLLVSNNEVDEITVNPDELFGRFVQGESSRVKESSGLGLSIVKACVERMAGTIQARREDGQFIIQVDFPKVINN